jgi:hypothetical protein
MVSFSKTVPGHIAQEARSLQGCFWPGAFTIAKPANYCFNKTFKMPRSPELPAIDSPAEL